MNPIKEYKNRYRRDTLIDRNLTSARKKRKISLYNRSTSPNKNFSITNENINSQVPDLTKDIDIDIDCSVKKAIHMLIQTKVDNSNDQQCSTLHSANICVVCDIFIISMEPVEWKSNDHLFKHKKTFEC